jgi:hypothetical protein
MLRQESVLRSVMCIRGLPILRANNVSFEGGDFATVATVVGGRVSRDRGGDDNFCARRVGQAGALRQGWGLSARVQAEVVESGCRYERRPGNVRID